MRPILYLFEVGYKSNSGQKEIIRVVAENFEGATRLAGESETVNGFESDSWYLSRVELISEVEI